MDERREIGTLLVVVFIVVILIILITPDYVVAATVLGFVSSSILIVNAVSCMRKNVKFTPKKKEQKELTLKRPENCTFEEEIPEKIFIEKPDIQYNKRMDMKDLAYRTDWKNQDDYNAWFALNRGKRMRNAEYARRSFINKYVDMFTDELDYMENTHWWEDKQKADPRIDVSNGYMEKRIT